MKRLIKNQYFWLILLFFTSNYTGVFAQQKLQVVTKTVSRQLDIKDSDTLKIYAEKANINISGWKGDAVLLKLDLISKHPQKETAEQELAYLDYQINEEEALIKNYFTTDNGFRKVKGNLSARYEIKVPEKLAMKIINKYGSLTIGSFKGFMHLDTRFVNNTIENCEGNQYISAIFGKTELLKSGGSVTVSLQKADLNVNYYTGKMSINSNYGFVTLAGDQFQGIDMQSTRTTIHLTVSNLQLYNYQLQSNNSKVILPGSPPGDKKGSNQYVQSFGTDKPLIKITNTYKPITLNLQYNVSNK